MISKNQIEINLKSNDKNQVLKTLLYLTFNIDDFKWAQKMCLDTINTSADEDVIGLAITCIGHIARIYKKIDTALVTPVLERKRQDIRFSGRVEDALDDITIFVKNNSYH
ncbi:hypothetical protein [Commensalibacter intestini]|nr:hypothetical protein [Commensalibacter intestini]